MAKTDNSRNRVILITALSMGITFGLLDVYIGRKSLGHKYTSVSSILIPLAVTTGFYFIAYLTSWYLIVSRLVSRFKLGIGSSAISNGFLIGTMVVSVSLNYEAIVRRTVPEKLLSLVFILMVSGIVAVLIYFVLTKIIEVKKPGITGLKASLFIPIVLGETLFFTSLQKFMAVPGTVVYASSLVAVLITIGVFYYINTEKLRVLSALTVIMLLIVLGGPLTVFVSQKRDTGTSGRKTGVKAPGRGVKHVILITVDTLRADVLSSYGSQSVKTPNIDGLSEDGVLFKNAYSSAPWTLPSFASIMTGLPPGTHLTTTPSSKLPTEFKTIAEYMLDSGYYTGAFVKNIFLHPEYNIDQGFIDYYHYPKFNRYVRSFGRALINFTIKYTLRDNANLRDDVTTENITDLSIGWLKENRDKDFFLWVHYFDPHQPYAPPEVYMADESKPPHRIGMEFNGAKHIRSGHLVLSTREREWIKELYDAEVRYVDDNLGRLFEYLKKSGLYEDSLIILTSDHGEEFWDHGGFEHGHALYNEVIHVPLIIKLPGENRTGEENMRVSTQSLMRTILDAGGIEYEKNSLIAGSLYPLIQGNGTEINEEPLVSTGLLYYEDRESLILGDMKYIHSLITNEEELYDLANDPDEQNTLSDEDKVLEAKRMLKKYNEQAKKLGSEYGVKNAEEVVLSKDKKEKLKALDYIQ